MKDPFRSILHASSPALFARERLDFTPDDTQTTLLNTEARRVILNCTRQWGKSTVTAAKAVHHAIHTPHSLTLILSPSERQSSELLRKCALFFRRAGVKTKKDGINSHSLQLENDSRLVALPNSEDTIRGFSGVSLLLIDEAARVPDSLYEAVLPMLATTNGSLWMLSTPAGRRGFFYEAATTASRTQQSPDREGGAGSPHALPLASSTYGVPPSDADTLSLTIPATRCPRISPHFLAEQRAARGELFYRQEYLCEFIGDQHSLFSRDLIESLLTSDIPPLDSTRHLTRALPSLPGSTSGAHPYIENPGPWTLTHTRYFAGLDLGQAHDSSALVILAADTFLASQRNPVTLAAIHHTTFTVVHAERFPLHTPYPDIVYAVARRFSFNPLSNNSTLAVDSTGVGAPVWDSLVNQRLPIELKAVILGSGHTESSSNGKTVVPKMDLIDNLRLALETPSLFFAAQTPDIHPLIDELSQLEASFRDSGSVSIEARSGTHDDLAIALTLALWSARKRFPPSAATAVREQELRSLLQSSMKVS
jgi:hypothetical protein